MLSRLSKAARCAACKPGRAQRRCPHTRLSGYCAVQWGDAVGDIMPYAWRPVQVSHNKGAGIIVREGGRGSFTAIEVHDHRPATRLVLYMAALRAESTMLQHRTTGCNAGPAAGWRAW